MGWATAAVVGLTAIGVGSQLSAAGDAQDAADDNARAEREAAQESIRRLRTSTRDLVGRQIVTAAAQGKDVRSRSRLELTREAMQESRRQAETIARVGVARESAIQSSGRAAAWSAYGAAAQQTAGLVGYGIDRGWWG